MRGESRLPRVTRVVGSVELEEEEETNGSMRISSMPSHRSSCPLTTVAAAPYATLAV